MRSAGFFYAGFEEERHPPHFLDSCLLCRKSLSQKCDIYMYRGDKAFCSQECRQEQIEMDEASEKRLKLSSSKRSNSVRQSKETSTESDSNKAVAVA